MSDLFRKIDHFMNTPSLASTLIVVLCDEFTRGLPVKFPLTNASDLRGINSILTCNAIPTDAVILRIIHASSVSAAVISLLERNLCAT